MFIYFICFLTIVLGLDYFFFIFEIVSVWKKHLEYVNTDTQPNLPFLSIVIAARNEESRISECLECIAANDYPSDQYEIIVVDDHSEDRTQEMIEKLDISNLKVLTLKDHIELKEKVYSYKKEALKLGVNHANGAYLLFTDADVVVPVHWISTMLQYIHEKNVNLVTGAVRYEVKYGFLQQFQALDVAGTMIWTASGIWSQKTYLANGANMIVKKSSFLDHFYNTGTDQISGDDVFLIQSIAQGDPDKVEFIKNKNTLVTTFAEASWSAFLTQRMRWAGKTSAYPNTRLKWRIARIYLFQIMLLILLVIGLINGAFPFWCFLGALVIKIIIDLYLFGQIKLWYNLRMSKSQLALHSLLHIFYICIIGTLAILKFKGRWKGRFQ